VAARPARHTGGLPGLPGELQRYDNA